MAYDVIALGETMAAFAAGPGDSLRAARTVTIDHAGAESNTCVGLARLGLRTAWVSRVGADTLGDRIVAALEAEGVSTDWVRRDASRPTGVMVKDPPAGVRYYRSGSAASAISIDDLDGVPISEARAVLVSGVTALIGPQPHATGLAFLERARGRRILDPSLRDGLWGSARRASLVLPFIERCDLLLAGSHEMAEIFDASPDDLRRLAGLTRERGPREIVIRAAGVVGALGDDGSWHTLPIERGSSVDPIGAGDAFNAGYIAVRLRGQSISDALAVAARCGAAVTATVSDTAGFPRDRSGSVS